MKISNKKIIVSTLALAMGAALAGSISGSVAWYQYSTRAAAQIEGTTAGTIGELQIQGKLASGSSWTDGGVNNKVDLGAESYKPMSMYEDSGRKYVGAPVYQHEVLPAQEVGEELYVDYELQFKFVHTYSSSSSEQLEKNVYLSYFDIAPKSGSNDVSGAVRVELLDGLNEFILSDVAEDDTGTTDVNELETITKGQLDLNGNNVKDTKGWDCTDTIGSAIDYVNKETVGEKYEVNAHDDVLVEVTDPYDLDAANATDKALIKTKTSGWSESLKVRIWLEGWALLNSKVEWTTDYLAQNFYVNMQFVCEASK